MTNTDTWFLLVQHRHRGRTDVTQYLDPSEAANAYSEAERRYARKMHGADPAIDVLLVGAASLEVVKERYPSYFTRETTKSAKVHKLLAEMMATPA